MIILMCFTGPVSAQEQEQWSIGGGYWTIPDVDTNEGALDTSGMFASVAMRSINYFIELDYSLQDPSFYVLAADYIYPLSQDQNYFGGQAFLGFGWTYFSADDLENESGFNLLLSTTFSDALNGTIRYDFLGSDQEMMTIGVSYSFY